MAADLEVSYNRQQLKLLTEFLAHFSVSLTPARCLIAALQDRKVAM